MFYNPRMLRLEQPDARYRETYLGALSEFRAEGNLRALHAELFHAAPDFEAFVARLREKTDRATLTKSLVPESVLWLVQDETLIGRVSVRHELNASLRELGGHIGYEIRPSKRHQGFGTRALRIALAFAQSLGIERALLTCDADNLGSRKIIEKNGGVLQDEFQPAGSSKYHRRYWIDLSGPINPAP